MARQYMFKIKKIKFLYIFIPHILIISIVWMFYFRKYILGITYIPYDSKDQFFLWSSFLLNSLKSGEFPLWNPNQFLGEDFIGNPQTLLFSPIFILIIIINWLLGTFNFGTVDFIELIHVLFSAIGLFFLLNILGISKTSSLVSSLMFMLAGPFASRLQHTPQIIAFSYIPWVLVSSYCLMYYRSIVSLIAFIIFTSALIIHFNQISYIGILLVSFYIIYLFFSQKRKKEYLKYYLGSLSISFFSILSLVFIPLVLVLNNILNSSRTDFSYEYASANIIHPITYLTFLSSNALFSSNIDKFSGTGDITEQYLYIGHVPIVIIILTFLYIIKNRNCRFWLLISLFFWVGTLGGKTIFYKLLFEFMPGFSLFRRPTDFSYFWIFSLSIIFSFGFDSLINIMTNNEKKSYSLIKFCKYITLILVLLCFIIHIITSQLELSLSIKDIVIDFIRITIFIVILLLSFRLLKLNFKFLQILLCLYLIVDLNANNSYKSFNSSRWWFDHFNFYQKNYTELIQKSLTSGDIPYRMIMYNSNSFEHNFPSAMKFQSVNGYNPIESNRYYYLKLLLFNKINQNFLNISGIRLISISKLNNYNININKSSKVLEDSNFEFRTNTKPVPRIYTVNSFLYDPNPEFTLEKMSIKNSKIKHISNTMAIVEDKNLIDFSRKYDKQTQTYFLNQNQSISKNNDYCSSQILDTIYKNNSIELKLNTSCNSLLVLTDKYFPGWYAFVDGVEQKIYRTNYFFRSVYIESGNHKVEFKYFPLKSGLKLIKNSFFKVN
ncbi:MAG: YfhO family protein [Sphaerospermopsis sp. SIO1G1]|nr:YfhO family protein [Sphaerospermopsis sp. SIO1G1]